MSRTFGLVLAGGRGTRLGGVRKATLRIGGISLLHRTLGAFEGQVEAVLVASGQGAEADGPLLHLRDARLESLGPLAGIRAAASHLAEAAAPDDILVSAAVDTPFLPADYVPRLRAAAQQAGAAYAAWGENIYPTNSAWRLADLLPALEKAAESAGPKAILTALGAVAVDWTEHAARNPFSNINTLEDLIALQVRALQAKR